MMRAFQLLLGCLSWIGCLSLGVSQQPVIGIYTQPYDSKQSYIAASYVKYLEMSGAQVIPLFYSLNQT